MRFSFLSSIVGAALLACAQAGLAQEGSIAISQPTEGAKLDGTAQNKVVYEVVPGPRGNHVHLYVDAKEVAILRQLKGEYTLKDMASGPHDICIKVVDKGHTPIGLDKCVKVSVQ